MCLAAALPTFLHHLGFCLSPSFALGPSPTSQGVALPGPWPVFGCDLKTLTHSAGGSHVVSGVTVADCIRFRMFVVLISVRVPYTALKPLRGPRGCLWLPRARPPADGDTCNELRESPQGRRQGPRPTCAFWISTCDALGSSGAGPVGRGQGAAFCGRGPKAGEDRHPFTVKSCPPGTPFPSTMGEASQAPGPCAAPWGGAVMCDNSGAVLHPPRPVHAWFPLGNHSTAT